MMIPKIMPIGITVLISTMQMSGNFFCQKLPKGLCSRRRSDSFSGRGAFGPPLAGVVPEVAVKWFCALLLCLLSACMTLYDVPDDVRLVNLKLEDGPYGNRTQEQMKYSEMIDVEVVTNRNYMKLDKGRYIYVEFYFCDQMDMDIQGLGGLPLYRYDNKWVHISGDKYENDKLVGPYHYHTAFSSFSHDKQPIRQRPTILDFDLRDSPRDLCFYIRAGALWALVSDKRSNIVRIPREMLIKFFAEHPRRTLPQN